MTEHPQKLSIAESLRKALVDDKDWAKWSKSNREQEKRRNAIIAKYRRLTKANARS